MENQIIEKVKEIIELKKEIKAQAKSARETLKRLECELQEMIEDEESED
jgi:hypothetical protein